MRGLSAPPAARAATRGRYGCRGPARDRGQVAVEFLGMFPLIIIVCVLLWQCALLGYTYILAGNAADEGARTGAVAGFQRDQECREAVESQLGSWLDGSDVDCRTDAVDGLYKADVELKVPILFPGTVSFPFTVTGEAAYVEEG
ncbi:TadE/TadG family type IV pilus assembly protein [Streptomyces formicae]|uniref:Pilus assembly protein n=1 Tax=Streptomyces formicae TaxID=1616117 RepID=A0ABY3WEP7_9ACTN|nr:TadE family protein [Streptomyces formicae]UNM11023.1 pilus assembly protein [Streptomyces formicae]